MYRDALFFQQYHARVDSGSDSSAPDSDDVPTSGVPDSGDHRKFTKTTKVYIERAGAVDEPDSDYSDDE
jgi:hypothetical protein